MISGDKEKDGGRNRPDRTGKVKIGGRKQQVSREPARRGRVPAYSAAQLVLRELGQRIKAIREGQGVSVAQLANETNIAPQTIIQFEDDGRPIRFLLMHQIAESLGYELEILLKQKAQ